MAHKVHAPPHVFPEVVELGECGKLVQLRMQQALVAARCSREGVNKRGFQSIVKRNK